MSNFTFCWKNCKKLTNLLKWLFLPFANVFKVHLLPCVLTFFFPFCLLTDSKWDGIDKIRIKTINETRNRQPTYCYIWFMKQKSIKGNLLKNCKVHYENKSMAFFNLWYKVIYDLWKKKIQGNCLKSCKVIFCKKNKKKNNNTKQNNLFFHPFITDTKSFSAKTLKGIKWMKNIIRQFTDLLLNI